MAYQNYINLTDDELDKPICRIMPVSRLLQCLEEKKLVLIPPGNWDDPFENWLLSSKFKLSLTGELGNMKTIRNEVYGQCWTQHIETDAMWRIYSSDKNGAKIKTTPRKLLEALMSDTPEFSDITCFIGKVCYQNQKKLVDSLESINLFNTNGSGVAKSLLYKRREFSYEKEVRIIYIKGTGAIHRFTIDSNSMFDEIVFDPRVDKYLFDAYKTAVVAKGFHGRVVQSSLYKPPRGLLISL